VTAVIATVLLTRRIPETDVQLTADVRELGFRVATEQPLTEPVVLSSLAVSGLRKIQLPALARSDSDAIEAPSIEFTALDSGTISLAPVTLPAGSRAWITKTGSANTYRLTLDSSAATIRVAVDGNVRSTARGMATRLIRYVPPQRFRLFPNPREAVELDLRQSSVSHDGATDEIMSDLPISALSLSHIEHFTFGDQSLARSVSSIAKGTLYLESLDGRPRSLRPSETLQIAVSRGDLLGLEVGRATISFIFQGRVSDLRIGAGESTRDLMPTLLDWLRYRHSVWLLWGTGVYLLTLYGTVRGLRKDG
jgi:hypothetical protein